MQKDIDVSIIMPVYNGQDHIYEAIESICMQTFSGWELVVVDDGSYDKTKDIVNLFSSKDDRINYYWKKNGGIVDALNFGLDKAKGKYIARMDADDISEADRIHEQLKFLKENKDVVVCGSNIEFIGKRCGLSIYPETHASCMKMLPIDPCFAHPAVMINRSLADQELRYKKDYEFVEDYDLWERLSRKGKFHNIQKNLLKYRVHDSQTTKIKRDRQIELRSLVQMRLLNNLGIGSKIGSINDFVLSRGVFDRSIASSISAALISADLLLKGCLDFKNFLKKQKRIILGER